MSSPSNGSKPLLLDGPLLLLLVLLLLLLLVLILVLLLLLLVLLLLLLSWDKDLLSDDLIGTGILNLRNEVLRDPLDKYLTQKDYYEYAKKKRMDVYDFAAYQQKLKKGEPLYAPVALSDNWMGGARTPPRRLPLP